MDQKTWLWRKRSTGKKVGNGEEVQQTESLPDEKEVDLDNSLKTLNEKMTSVLDECSAKDELVQKLEKIAEDATADKQKAEEELQLLKEELNEVQKQRAAENERLGHLNSALKDCMEQLNLVRNEQGERVHNAVMEASKEFQKSHEKLEENNSYLSKALLVKEKLIEDLTRIKNQTEFEFEALMMRLDSVEKENSFLRYEFRTLEKELDLRNEEMEYSRRSAEASNRKHLESIKKIKKLEGECQRLRSLTRKRLPGPAALASIKSDTEGRNQVNTNKQLGFLIDQLQDLMKENKNLKECLAKKEEETFYHQVSTEIRSSDMSLMDDFVEMEKLAIVAVDTPLGISSDESCTNKELVLVEHGTKDSSSDEASKLPPVSGYIAWKSHDDSTIRDEFVKHLGGDGPGTALELESVQNLMLEMEKMYLTFQVEIEGLKNELNANNSSDKELNENKMETLKESKRMIEEQLENLKVINEDLDTQLNVTKVKLNEAVQKLTCAKVELDSKTHFYEELEGTCVELQLQLESIKGNRHSGENENQEELIRTGMEMTKASVKLAECEETILKLGTQLKALGSTKELSFVDKVLSMTHKKKKKKKKKLDQRSSLRDQMLSEDSVESPETKEVVSTNTVSFQDEKVAYIGMSNGSLNSKTGALVINVPRKSGGFALLRKLLVKRKKGSCKSSSIYFGK